MASTPKLWSWVLSPFAAKVRIACAETGMAVELLEIDPRHRPARLRELNPTGRVPVLELDGVAVRESTAICELVADTAPHGARLWPAEPVRRAAARGLLRFVDDELTVPFFLSLRKQAFGLDATDHPEAIDHLRGRLTRNWAKLEGLLERTPTGWLAGTEEASLVDLAAIPLAVRLPQWLPAVAPDPADHPRASAWLQTLGARESAAEVDRRGTPVA